MLSTLIYTSIGYAENIVRKKENKVGLDQYAYVAARAGQREEFWQQDADATGVSEPREIAYWRKHPNLQGWMCRLWESKGNSGSFNGDELELTWEDLERLELDVIAGTLPGTTGFFFGEVSDEHYRNHDLEFIKNARAELFMGLKVFYNSSW